MLQGLKIATGNTLLRLNAKALKIEVEPTGLIGNFNVKLPDVKVQRGHSNPIAFDLGIIRRVFHFTTVEKA